MAGYKNSLLRLKPDCLITFDGDTVFDANGYLAHPNIPDTSGQNNHAFIHAVPEPIKSYAMGTRSLVPREDGMDQFSMTFGTQSYLGARVSTFPYPSSKLEIFHSDTLRCEDEFTVSFLFQKTDRDSFISGARYNPVTNKYVTTSGVYNALSRTIFQKGDDIWMRWRREGSWASYDYLDFKFPGPVTSGDYTYRFDLQNGGGRNIITTGNYTDRQIHIVMTRRKEKIGTALFQTTDSVYIDGILYYKRVGTPTSEPYTALNTSSIFIGGNQQAFSYDSLNDRQTTPLMVDNFAVFSNKCLTEDEVSWLYKKIYDYDTYTKRWDPQLYIQMAESTINSFTDPNNVSHTGYIDVNKRNATLTYVGNKSQVQLGVVGPERLIYNKAIKFQANGMAKIITNYSSPVLSSTSEWTLDFFVSFVSSTRGVIFSALSDVWPFKGILIEANVGNDRVQDGSIQVSLEDGLFVSTNTIDAFGNRVRYNDGKFHHISVVRRNSRLELWVDGVLQEDKQGNTGEVNANFGQIYLMGTMPDNLSVTGSMCQLTFFPMSLSPANIKSRSYFFTRTVVEGYVTLKGIPHAATVRCFERTSGKFITQGIADPNTGWYQIDVWSQNYIDVMFFDLKNPGVRPRALGPYLAYEYTDIDDLP